MMHVKTGVAAPGQLHGTEAPETCDRCGVVDSPEGYGHCANCDAKLCRECLTRDNVSGESFCPSDAKRAWVGCLETVEAIRERAQ